MAALRNPRFEIIAQELAVGKTAEQASELAGFDPTKSSFGSNARKRACRDDIQKRKAEIQYAAAKAAGVTCEYSLQKIWDCLEFDITEFTDGDDLSGRRSLDIATMPREKLSKLCRTADFQFDQVVSEGKHTQRTLHTRIRRYDPTPLLTLAARLQGFLRDKSSVELTGKEGDPLTRLLQEIAQTPRGLPKAAEAETN